VTKTGFSRRILPFIAVAGITLSACGSANPIASADEAFRFNGASYSISDLDALNDALVAVGQYTAENGILRQQDVATTLGVLIRYEAYRQFIAENNLEETDADRQAVEDEANSDPNFASYPEALRTTLLNLNVSDRVAERITAPTSSELKKLYDKMPASAGVLCLSHILVDTEEEARDVLKELNSGEKFADVAAARSTEPGADQSGGALKNGEEDCSALGELQQSFDGDFMVGAVDAKPGVPSGPVKSQFGWHIILSHAFDDIKESATRVVAANPGAVLLSGYLAGANVTVNSKYGSWNSATGQIN
jgi:parvulin-like peptidyl-prolyl isomerase